MNLGELRQYVADYLADAADGKADRVIQRIANNALSMVYGAHAWTRFRALAHVPLDQALTRATLTATLDSDRVTLGAAEVFPQKFVDQKWKLTVTGEDRLIFELGHLENDRAARLATGQKWIQATAAAVAATFKRTVYPLPDGCLSIRRVELAGNGICLVPLSSHAFDRLKYESPTETGHPQYFTARTGEIEVWPALGASTSRQSLVISYERQPAVFKVTDDDALPVDWDPRWDDLIRLACDLELASKHQSQSKIDPGLARASYRERLLTCKADDEGLVAESTQMTLGLGSSPAMTEEYIFRRSAQGPDA